MDPSLVPMQGGARRDSLESTACACVGIPTMFHHIQTNVRVRPYQQIIPVLLESCLKVAESNLEL